MDCERIIRHMLNQDLLVNPNKKQEKYMENDVLDEMIPGGSDDPYNRMRQYPYQHDPTDNNVDIHRRYDRF
jgi:hypothetical protein